MTHLDLEIIDTWVVYDRGPAMFPGLAYAADGTLLASFSTVPDGLPGGEIHLIRSRDGGRSWDEPAVVARSRRPGGAVLNAVGLTRLSDGTLLLPLNDVVTEPGFIGRDATLHTMRSRDAGQTWDGWAAVAPETHEPFTYGQIVELPGGGLLCPIWGRSTPGERWRAAVLHSHDGGHTWPNSTTIAYDPAARLKGEYVRPAVSGFDEGGQFDPSAIAKPNFRPHSAVDGFSETSVIALGYGRLLAILRQQGVDDDRLTFFQSSSTDGGRTWSTYRRTNLCGMSPCLHRSPAGRLLLAYRRWAPDGVSGAVPGLSIAASDDNGASWDELATLREPKGFAYTSEYQVGYPALVNTPAGEILAVFYSYDPSSPHPRYLAANLLRER